MDPFQILKSPSKSAVERPSSEKVVAFPSKNAVEKYFLKPSSENVLFSPSERIVALS